MIYELELKYQTSVTQETFEHKIHSITKGIQTFDLHLKYTDVYYYSEVAGLTTSFFRFRKDQYKKTLTFKEELFFGNSRRLELNIDQDFTQEQLNTLAAILGFNKSFSITKEAIVIKAPGLNREFSWYEVNGAKRFIEVELIGRDFLLKDDELYEQTWLKTTDNMMKGLFEKKIKKENKSLFKLYKPSKKARKLSPNLPVLKKEEELTVDNLSTFFPISKL